MMNPFVFLFRFKDWRMTEDAVLLVEPQLGRLGIDVIRGVAEYSMANYQSTMNEWFLVCCCVHLDFFLFFSLNWN